MFANKSFPLLFGLLLGTITTSCNQEKDTVPPGIPMENSIVIEGISDSTWTYFSFVTGKVVGKSPFGDAAEDSSWYIRTDWDIALCSDMLRTNSGTSGIGKGGIQAITTRNFNAITTAPEEGYVIDSNDVVVKR